MNEQTRIKYSYVSILPEEMSPYSSAVRISHKDSTVKELLDQLCVNSQIKDENGKSVSSIFDINYEVIE